MTVLFVSRSLPLPVYHGDRLILRHLVAGLRARGHRVVVAALTGPGDEEPAKASAALCDRLETVAERRRGPIDYLGRLRRPFPQSAAGGWNPAMWQLAARLAAEESPGVVHFLGGIQVSECRAAVGQIPALITPYESHTLWLDRAVHDARAFRERWRWRLRRLVAAAFERRIYQGFRRVVVLTEDDATRLASLAPNLPLVIVPNGVAGPDRVVPIAQRREPLLLFVGNFAYEPNAIAARVLVREVFPLVRSRMPEARVALVGAAPPPEVLALDGGGVDVTGEVADVAPWLGRARVFVAALTRGAGMKNKVLEALAHGAPLVATPRGCDGIAIVDGVHGLVAEQPHAVADAVTRLLVDDDLAATLATNGRALVEARYRWAGVVETYERLYGEIGGTA